MYKSTTLERANIQSIIGCAANDYSGQVAIVPVTKRGISNTTHAVVAVIMMEAIDL